MADDKRIKREKRTVAEMVRMYCRDSRHGSDPLCDNCERLLAYANQRIDRCIYQRFKPVCSKCRIHCYQPDMREKIKEAMRYSGPRMLFSHPILGSRHMLDRFRKYPDTKQGFR